jgi:hypothetical protein
MARIKTHYKRYADGGAVDLKVTEHEPPGDASAAFQAQIDALRQAETHAARAATQHNLTPRQQKFIDDHPEMLAEPDRLSRAILDAHMANRPIDSDEFHEHVANAFRIQHLETAAHNTASLHHPPGTLEHHREADATLDKLIADVNDTPKFFKPKPIPERDRAAMYSAPVSREGTTATRGSGYLSDNPGRITLTAEERSIAKAIGQSDIDYARGKIELARRKAEGHYDR